MKPIYKTIILLILINLGGCCAHDCNQVPTHFDINGFNASIQRITGISGDGIFTTEPVDSTQKVDFEKFVIQLYPVYTFYGNIERDDKFDFASLFSNAAYACKCQEPGYEGTSERISEINIFSSYPFTGSGSVADTLSRYFDIDGYQSNGWYQVRASLVSIVNTGPLAFRLIRLFLNVKPVGSLKQKFTVEYKQSNGEVYIMHTQAVTFNP
jgi:hypothetical protein